MIRDALAAKVATAVQSLHRAGKLPSDSLGPIEIADTKLPEHGDYACNLAMTGAKAAGMNPRALGELLANELENDKDLLSVEVAGPGFINLRLTPKFLSSFIPKITSTTSLHPQPSPATPSLRINVEFVSVNPNGPITIGSGRGAAYGSTLCNVMQAAGHTVHREYYINDGVNSEQMRLFAESVRSHYESIDKGATGHTKEPEFPFPEGGYKGDYVEELAQRLYALIDSDQCMDDVAMQPIWWWQRLSQDLMLAAQRDALSVFGVEFDTWFSEQSLHDSGLVAGEVEALEASGVADAVPHRFKLKLAKGGKIEDVEIETQATDEEDTSAGEGAGDTLWLRSTKFGDDMDRVLRRRDGRLTYIASDVAYHKDKFNRPANADKLITVLGPDHHGYIGRLTAVVAAMLKAESGDGFWKGGKLWSTIETDPYGKWRDFPEREARMAIAQEHGLGFVDLERVTIEPELIQLLPVQFMSEYQVLPVKQDGSVIYVAVADLGQTQVIDAISKITGLRTIPVSAVPDLIRGTLTKLLPKADSDPLSETDAILYASPEERDACHAALSEAKNKLEVQIFQLVRFLKDGKPAPMRKRDGNIFALIDLINEIGERMRPEGTQEEKQQAGTDVARFFYLMRSHDTTFDFDLNLAETKSDENPVFYVQYAHARICSILAKAEAENLKPTPGIYTETPELSLIKKIADLPVEIRRCADDYGVHRLVTYAIELARAFHHFYNECRVISPEDPATSARRLALCKSTQCALKASLDLLGVSAPEKM